MRNTLASLGRQARCGLALACAALILVDSSLAAGQEKRPNVLLIMVDDLRPELNIYGASHIKSPNIDRLGATGTVFNRAYSQFPVCSPSRASMLSGTRPTSTKVYDLYSNFREALPNISSLPEHFKNNGYFTDRFGKIFHIDDAQSWSPEYPKQQFGPRDPQPRAPYYNAAINEAGWKKFELAKAQGMTGVPLERAQRGPAYEIADAEDDELLDGQIARDAVLALERAAKQDKPFFLAVGFHKPHLPFSAPRKYWDMYDREGIAVAKNTTPPSDAPYALGNGAEFYTYTDVPKERPVPDDYARIARHGYYACVSFVDTQIGRVLDALEAEGLAKNTVVLLVGDHGFKLGEHGGWGKSTNFEVDARVPLIVRAPGLPGGQQAAGLVEMVDIFPTLVELTGLPLPSHLEGESFAPLVHNAKRAGKKAAFTQMTRSGRIGYSMRTEKYRFTKWIKAGEPDAWELYDATSDPDENYNLATHRKMRSVCKKMSKQMDKMITVEPLGDKIIDEP